MSENPFESPKAATVAEPPPIPGLRGGNIKDFRAVAVYQKVVLICLLIYVIALFAGIAMQIENPRSSVGVFTMFVGFIVSFVACVFVFAISVKVFGLGIGITLGLLTLVPVFGLVAMLIVNIKAVWLMKTNRIDVGFLGANIKQIDAMLNASREHKQS